MAYEHGGNVHKQLRENGGSLDKLLDFSANINPLGVSKSGQAHLISSLEWMTHYPDPEYIKLKDALSSYYECEPNQIGLFNGAAEGMHTLFAYLQPQKAMLLGPSFVEYEKILNKLGSQIHWHLLSAERGFQVDETLFLAELSAEKPDLVVLCTPNNPTGVCLSNQFLEMVAQTLKLWGGSLVVDEAFVDFLSDERAKGLFPTLNQRQKNIYIFRSLTKFFAMPGLRLGALLTRDDLFLNWLSDFGVSWRINSAAEAYAIAATKDIAYVEQSRAFIQEEKEVVYKALNNIQSLTVFKSEADYHLICLEAQHGEKFKNELLNRQIMIRDCGNYKGLTQGYFRIAVKGKLENRQLIEAVKEVVSCL